MLDIYQIVEEFTKGLDALAEPCLGLPKYGKLRKNKWPASLPGKYTWSMFYELANGSTHSINVWYSYFSGRFSPKHEGFTLDEGGALDHVRQRVAEIPKERVDEFTKELGALVEPYLGRTDYGNLRKGHWPAPLGGYYNWPLLYDLQDRTTKSIAVWLDEDLGLFSEKDDNFRLDSKSMIKYVGDQIKRVQENKDKPIS